jgi:hypothetical protein
MGMKSTEVRNLAAGLVVDRHVGLFGETCTATFSADRTYRYALTRRWPHDGAPWAAFVMLNPSTADAFTVDPTIRRCESFAKSWGRAGLLVVNLFGLRATDPTVLSACADPVGPDNDAVVLETLLGNGLVGPVIVAWGSKGSYRDRGLAMLQLLADNGIKPLCLGVTRSGQPRHPLYMRAVTRPEPYPGDLTVALVNGRLRHTCGGDPETTMDCHACEVAEDAAAVRGADR